MISNIKGFRGRGRGFHRGFGERATEPERRAEEESAPDSQDLSSAASLDRGIVFGYFNRVWISYNRFF